MPKEAISPLAQRIGLASGLLSAAATFLAIPQVKDTIVATAGAAQRIAIKRRKKRIRAIRQELKEERRIRLKRLVKRKIKGFRRLKRRVIRSVTR